MNFQEKVYATEHGLQELKKDLAAIAECSFQEYKTAAYIEKFLSALPLRITSGIAQTGVVAYLDNQKEKTVLLRADMDALPCAGGARHNCGHNVHMAVLLHTAAILCEMREQLSVNVLFVFQPGEETTGGAEPMIATGILEKYHVFTAAALHVNNAWEAGTLVVPVGAVMACPDDYEITVRGRGGHGAHPEECVDSLRVAAEILPKLDALTGGEDAESRRVVTVCALHGGESSNIIPDAVSMLGTARAYSESVRAETPRLMEKIIKQCCYAAGAEYTFSFHYRYPPLRNDVEAATRMQQTLLRYLPEEQIVTSCTPAMLGDDFSYFARAVPSVYLFLGSGDSENGISMPLHAPDFETADACLKHGVLALGGYVLSFGENDRWYKKE